VIQAWGGHHESRYSNYTYGASGTQYLVNRSTGEKRLLITRSPEETEGERSPTPLDGNIDDITLVADGVEVQVRDSATVNAGLQSHNGAAIRFMQDLVVNAPITLDGGDISVAGNVSLQQSPIPGTELTGELATGGVLTVPDNNL